MPRRFTVGSYITLTNLDAGLYHELTHRIICRNTVEIGGAGSTRYLFQESIWINEDVH